MKAAAAALTSPLSAGRDHLHARLSLYRRTHRRGCKKASDGVGRAMCRPAYRQNSAVPVDLKGTGTFAAYCRMLSAIIAWRMRSSANW